jgi:hypothetical protein
VSQISPPIRIVLAVAVVFLAAWMTVLKPKSDTSTPPAPTPAGNVNTGAPAQTGFGKAVEAAKGAAAATDAHTGKVFGDSDTATGTATATGKAKAGAAGATVAAADLKGVPSGVVKAIKKHDVVVLGFVTGQASDDRAVRTALKKVDRWNGRVWVKSVPLGQIARYGRVARGVDVEQSPTVVVIDHKLAATPLVGYVDGRTIDQAVVDALRASGGVFTSGYLRDVNAVCTRYTTAFVSSPADASAKRWKAFVADLAAVKAPAKLRGFRSATLADAKAMRGNRAAQHRFYGRMAKRHVLSCTA